MNKLDSYTPLGYSLCGVVTEVGRGAEEFKVGQLVAAAGNEHALHAEYNWVPVNLCAAVPPGVLPEHAAFSTVGVDRHARRAARRGPARRDGGRDRPRPRRPARGPAADRGRRPGGRDRPGRRTAAAWRRRRAPLRRGSPGRGWTRSSAELARITSGRGADHVFLCRGRIDQRPGRGGREAGQGPRPGRRHRQDEAGPALERLLREGARRPVLPVLRARAATTTATSSRASTTRPGYVRWTEKRNLESFLDLIARNELEVASLDRRRLPDGGRGPGLRGPEVRRAEGRRRPARVPGARPDAPPPATSRVLPAAAGGAGPAPFAAAEKAPVSIGFIGAGNYASSMLLPNLARLEHRAPGARRDHQVAFGGQRPAEVRLRHGVDDGGRGARGRRRWTRSSS